jgi:hypothetical protein
LSSPHAATSVVSAVMTINRRCIGVLLEDCDAR